MMSFLSTGLWQWTVAVLLGLVSWSVVRFYLKVSRYPKGPVPLPLIGNILSFRGIKHNVFLELARLTERHGPVFTFWIGPNPMVIVSDLELVKEAFNSKNNEFNGRPFIATRELFERPNQYSDVVFADDVPTWISLRRVAHSAVRKFATSDRLPDVVSDVVDEVVMNIKDKEGIGKPFNPFDYLYLTILNIVATAAFGKRYKIGDPDFVFIQEQFEKYRKQTKTLIFADIPVVKWFLKSALKRATSYIDNIVQLTKKSYQDRTRDFEPGIVRDFSDALISAKEEALRDHKESAPFLTDANLALVLGDLFFAGTDTSNYTLRWILFFIAKYPDIQIKMRREIENEVGDRIPTQNDKSKLHLVQAFITECLRHRGVAPMSIPHRVLSDGRLGEHRIAYDYNVLVAGFNYLFSHDPKHWQHPNRFDPQRFLDGGKFVQPKSAAYCPFGIGKRVCLGEKLALEDLFLVTVRLLQSTSGMMLVFPDGPDSYDEEPDPNMAMFCVPKPYQVLLKKVETTEC